MIELLGRHGAETALIFCILPVALLASWHDLRSYRIPNELSLAGLAIFVVTCALFLPLSDIPARLLGGVVVFAFCFVMFIGRAMGGGDAKLMPVIALFIPGRDALTVLLALAVSGLACVVLMGVITMMRRLSWSLDSPVLGEVAEWRVWSGGSHVPYALAMTGALTLYLAARLMM